MTQLAPKPGEHNEEVFVSLLGAPRLRRV